MSKVTPEEISRFLEKEFPQSGLREILAVGNGASRVRKAVGPSDLRPGNTVSGPVLMAVADLALYVAIFGEIGIVPLAVTTSLSFNFLRKPVAGASIIGDCKLLKVGRALVVGEVALYSEGSSEPVAHAVGTYSIPPDALGKANAP